MPDFSKEQDAAIRETAKSLLVSAAAGSGKTATLSERCAHLACSVVSVSEMLVVTFTEEAAAEMRSRIERALASRLDSADEATRARIRKQLALLPGAQISTIHGFCSRILKRQFQAVEIDPAFRVLDAQESALLQLEVADEVFEAAYAAKDAAFAQLVDLYADGNDTRIEEQLIATYNVLRSQLDSETWCKEAIARLEDVSTQPALFDSRLGRDFLRMVGEHVEQLTSYCEQVRDTLLGIPEGKDCADVLAHVWSRLDELRTLVTNRDWDKASGLLADEFVPTLKRGPASPERDRAKELMESVTKQVKKGSELYRYFSRTPEQFRTEIIGTLPVARCFLDLVGKLGHQYALAKQEANAVDFSDLEHLALRVLGNDAISADYRARFRFVMIDEFQDVNAIQWALLGRIARLGSDSKPNNLFCVGDVKQSIYRFRLADPTIFQDRQRDWTPATKSGHVINMRHNFRSRKPLLDAINIIFRQLMHEESAEIEYDPSQELDGQRRFPAPQPNTNTFTGSPIELHLILDSESPDTSDDAETPAEEDTTKIEREARHAATVAKELIESGRLIATRDGAYRPLAYGDIAILLRSAKVTIAEYSRALQDVGVPAFAESRSGFFKATEIQDMLSILKLLDNQQQDIPLAAFLRSPIARVKNPDNALAAIRIAYPFVPFHEAVRQYAAESKEPLAAQLRSLLDRLADWRNRSLMLPVADLLWDIFSQTGYVAFCRGLEGGEQRVANLMYLHRCARQFSNFQRQGLYRFMEYLGRLEEEQDLGQPSPGEPGNAVRVMTIHGAKGLEFPVVILSGLNTRFNKRDAAGSITMDRERYLGIGVADEKNDVRYPSAATWLVKDQIDRSTMAEELRVLYVAMTRAQEHLVLIADCDQKQFERLSALPPCGDNPLAFRSASTFLHWVLPLVKTSDGAIKVVLASPQPAPKPAAPLEEPADEPTNAGLPLDLWCKPYAHEPLTRLSATTSVTGLSKGNETPRPAIAIDHEEQASDHPSASAEEAKERGIAVHLFMEHLDFSASAQPLDVQLQTLTERGALTARQGSLVNLDDVRWFIAESPLARLVRDRAAEIVRELPILDSISPREIPGELDGFDRVLLRGRIDAVLPSDEGIAVIDYKTDRTFPEPGSDREKAYKEQVNLYRRTIERSGLGGVSAVHLVFLASRRILSL